MMLAFSLMGLSAISQGQSAEAERDYALEGEVLDSKPLGILGVSGGLAMPIGSFKQRGLNISGAGYAKTGWTVNFIEAARFLTDEFGLGVRWSRHQLGYDFESLEKEFDQINISFSNL